MPVILDFKKIHFHVKLLSSVTALASRGSKKKKKQTLPIKKQPSFNVHLPPKYIYLALNKHCKELLCMVSVTKLWLRTQEF